MNIEYSVNSALQLRFFYRGTRKIIMHHLEQKSPAIFDGVVELNESYSDDACKRKRCDAMGKIWWEMRIGIVVSLITRK